MPRKPKIPPDPRGGHVRLYWAIVDSPAWRALSPSDRSLYIAIRRKLLATNNGNIEASLGSLRDAGIRSSATLAKGLRSLATVGLIQKTRQGGIAYGRKVCSLYRFTDELVFEHPRQGVKAMSATHDWRVWVSVADARSAIVNAHEAAKRPVQDRAGVQESKHVGSSTARKTGSADSTSEAVDIPHVH